MSLAEILVDTGSFKKRKRVGRGIGSGKGKTSGRGVKGQKSRSGVAIKGFEGGQMPIYRRLPKRGFNNIFSTSYQVVNLSQLQKAIDDKKIDAKKTITLEILQSVGLIRNANNLVKILGNGEINTKISFESVNSIAFSKSALNKIENAAGATSQKK